jgi:hypothetical protein
MPFDIRNYLRGHSRECDRRFMRALLAKLYSAKTEDCLRQAEKALQSAKDHVGLGEHWAALALEPSPSGALPWEVRAD